MTALPQAPEPAETSDPAARLTVAEADPFGTEAMLICPACLEPFEAPGDSAGADIDCPFCPWDGKAGEPIR